MTDFLNALVLFTNFVGVPALAYGSQLALGALGVTLFGLDVALLEYQPGAELLSIAEWWSSPNAWRVAADILLLGLFGGFYIVPLNATVQQRSDPRHRSRIIAANNVLNALGLTATAPVWVPACPSIRALI